MANLWLSPFLLSALFEFAVGSDSILRGMHFEIASDATAADTLQSFNAYYDPAAKKLRGMGPDMWEWMSKEAGFTYNISMIPYTTNAAWLAQVFAPDSAFAFGSSFWTMNTLTLSQYTMSIPTISYGWMIATQRPKHATVTLVERLLTFKQPMSNEVWLVIVLCILAVGVFMWGLERKGNDEDFEGDRANAHHGIPLSVWMSFMQFTGGGGHTAHTLPGRIFSVVWTFVIMVLLAVYTANLAAFFTSSQNLSPLVDSMSAIAINGGPVCSSGSFAPDFVRSQISNPIVISQTYAFRQALLGVANGSCVAAIDKNVRYRQALSETRKFPALCGVQMVGQAIGYSYMGFIARQDLDPHLIAAVNVLIGRAYQNGVLADLTRRYLGQSISAEDVGPGCAPPPAKASQQIGVVQLIGLFILFAFVSAGAWALHLFRQFKLASVARGAVSRASSAAGLSAVRRAASAAAAAVTLHGGQQQHHELPPGEDSRREGEGKGSGSSGGSGGGGDTEELLATLQGTLDSLAEALRQQQREQRQRQQQEAEAQAAAADAAADAAQAVERAMAAGGETRVSMQFMDEIILGGSGTPAAAPLPTAAAAEGQKQSPF